MIERACVDEKAYRYLEKGLIDGTCKPGKNVCPHQISDSVSFGHPCTTSCHYEASDQIYWTTTEFECEWHKHDTPNRKASNAGGVRVV